MNQQNDGHDRNFNIPLQLTNVPAATGGTNLPKGLYRAKVTDMYIKADKPGRVVIKVEVCEGPFAGVVRTTGIGIPTGPEDKQRYYWRSFLESVGYGPAELDTGATANIGAAAGVGRVSHIRYTPKEETTTGYDQTDFLPPADWSKEKQSFVPSTPAATTGNDAGAAAQAAAMLTGGVQGGGQPGAQLGGAAAQLGLGQAPAQQALGLGQPQLGGAQPQLGGAQPQLGAAPQPAAGLGQAPAATLGQPAPGLGQQPVNGLGQPPAAGAPAGGQAGVLAQLGITPNA